MRGMAGRREGVGISGVGSPRRSTARLPGARIHLAAAVAAAIAAVAIAAPALAQPAAELLWSFQANGNMQAIVACPDLDGDHGPDIVFEGYENGPSGVDHVFAIRGRSAGAGQVIWSARPIGGVSSGGGYGENCLRLGPDLNGDGARDILLGTAWGGRTAYALNGLSGATLWSYDTYAHYGNDGSGWIYGIDELGSDLTGDGVAEVVFCSGSYNDRVHCVDGATGALEWVVYGQDAYFDIRAFEDIDGDGVRDLVAALGDNTPITPRVVAYSGDDGRILWQRPVAGTIWNLALIGDINADGRREIVPGQWATDLTCISGRDGSVLWSVPHARQQRVAALDDVSGDGIDDIAIGFNMTSACRVCSGADGSTIWNRPLSDWTWAVDRIADCTGDHVNDVAVGDFDGYVTLLDGASGAIFWQWLNPTRDKVKTIRGVPDLNGNGAPDIVAGTQLLYGGAGGDVYALEGNSEASGVAAHERSFAGLRVTGGWPSPASGPVTWSLFAERSCVVRLLVFAPDGRCLRDLGTRGLAAGQALPVAWDGRDREAVPVPAGVYLARVIADGRAFAERRAVILR